MPKRKLDFPELVRLEEMPPPAFIESVVPGINRIIGGLPARGIVEMYGNFSSGKTSVALTFQPDFWIAVEYLDPRWGRKFSPNTMVAKVTTLEKAFELLEKTLLPGKPRLVVLDSLGGAIAEAEVDSNRSAAVSGATSRGLRKLINLGLLDETCLLIVNQLRSAFGAQYVTTTTPGGFVLHHLALMRIEVRRMGVVEVGERKVGQEILIRVTKNKVGPPWAEGKVWLSVDGYFFDSEEEVKAHVRLR